jgi:hypothetical protein
MTNATATHSGGVCTITLPSNTTDIVLIPTTSGIAAWKNYCVWTNTTNSTSPQALGEWSAQGTNMTVLSDPLSLINTTTNHGTITTGTTPASSDMTTMTLDFTHTANPKSPKPADDLHVAVTAAENMTVITIMAEDGGGTNYLDFYMTITITTPPSTS